MTSYLHQPNMNEFFESREKLKELIRKKTQNGNNVATTSSEPEQRRRKFPYNDFGSFFGPSQPVIAPRVLQATKSMFEKEQSSDKTRNSVQTVGSTSKTNNANEPVKSKAEKLKDARDYSFLFSDDAELPVSAMELPSLDVPSRSKESQMDRSKAGSSGSNMHPRTGSSNVDISKARLSSKENQIGHSRPGSSGNRMGSKAGSSTITKASSSISKNGQSSSRLTTQRPAPPTRKPDSVLGTRQIVPKREGQEQRKVSQEHTSRSQMFSRKPQPLKQQSTQPLKKKKRPERPSKEDELALEMIRKMCKTDRYMDRDYDDYDDSDMEANFEDIQKEEKRSLRLAKKEDARELRLIQEQERRERLAKEKKKQKLSH